jgi:hypothetical protein
MRRRPGLSRAGPMRQTPDDQQGQYTRARSDSPVLPGSGSALLRSRPFRTVRARCRAHGSSKPRGWCGWKCRFAAVAGFGPALAVCVHQAGAVIAARAGFTVVGGVAGGYRLAGDLQPPPFPLLG